MKVPLFGVERPGAARTARRAENIARRFVAAVLLLALFILPACRIGSGFDTAEKRRNLTWDEPVQAASQAPDKPDEPASIERKPTLPIVYLLVAG